MWAHLSGGDDITLESLHPRTFDKDSPVTAYWLTRCDGFRVAGLRGEAVVDGTVYDDDPSKPLALRIRRGPTDTSLIPLHAVDGMCPTRRIVYVRRRPSVRSRAAAGMSAGGRRAGRTTARAAATSWRYASPRMRAGARESAAAARRQWPAVQRGAYAVARGAVLVALMLGTVAAWALANAVRLADAGYAGARRTASHVARAGRFVAERRLHRPPEHPLELLAGLLRHARRGQVVAAADRELPPVELQADR